MIEQPPQNPFNEGFDYSESLLPPTEQEELNQLRREQIDGINWTSEKRARFLELSNKEEVVRAERRK
ncbi:MAG: hypothetical protein A3C70_03230 [Candidatus Zambryskibacteria bacterium RIFCSPHIGHO2_02_FULL_43_14]|uniref:Uncharacterized protein n=1 Tax=Candidatus Zambryskibacteria bacterium RIFCSPHIGHO2_02_FULL_43_14 TaxID=1802748 RepID=A0A1G2TEM0_9BACT|nr:MAG: hypothetical protein A2829_01035 [Candidatus Zambryskibacteria bacterium RIFCSPHIGHO2_01_FULL_43_60]OHA95693.1 MAG: hypothetical protein A3C70_03230 [Candidatus Zambryskibacteria bacterium RIFCSPHIGHO2_02_FULL_43_14]OHB03867.1 MAG: hypothetical protein A3B03_03680 [Candidatus Zambryskibacteria bacterium RIFCSPLOWO2_01_FULL_42_41]